MPAQVADWSEVKATAIATGNLKRAAELHGLQYGAVRVRAHREQWPVGQRVHVTACNAKAAAAEQMVRASEGRVTAVTSASEAIAQAQADHSRRSRSAGLEYAAHVTEFAARKAKSNPGIALELAPLVKSSLQGAAIAGDWQAASGPGSVRIDIYAGGVERQVEGRVIEQE